MALHLNTKVAGRSFEAMCGHRVPKGEAYITTDDYINWNHMHQSFCVSCWNKQSNLQFVNGHFEDMKSPDDFLYRCEKGGHLFRGDRDANSCPKCGSQKLLIVCGVVKAPWEISPRRLKVGNIRISA